MGRSERLPRAVLICHEAERIDAEGLASWLATAFDLVGLVVLRERSGRFLKKARREIARAGLWGFLDVLAFRLYYRLGQAKSDEAWIDQEVRRLRARYPAALTEVPRILAADPNGEDVAGFLKGLHPDMVIARCKFILKPEIFGIATAGTFIFHPGICPEYRNAHGCFWALVNRDLDRVGMTLLRADKGVDTGPMFLQAGCDFDEVRESHTVIQHRVVFENLEALRQALMSVWNSEAKPLSAEGRRSAVWGQPRLSAYLRWKRAARRRASELSR